MSERIIKTRTLAELSALFGVCDKNAEELEKAFGVTLKNRSLSESGDSALEIDAPNSESLEAAADAVVCLLRMIENGSEPDAHEVAYVIETVKKRNGEALKAFEGEVVCLSARAKPIKPKTLGQRAYVNTIKNNTVVFGLGPAGTGKTFLAVACAVRALRDKAVSRIVLTRPAVEAGEKLGFLPGDPQEKIDPYLRPLYDALYDLLGSETAAKYAERGVLEIAPLAYMRGRTLDDAFIILDEAQNTTPEQMKMFLTRLGFGSKAVITGDLTQTDLPPGKKSGLAEAVEVLKNVDDIAVHRFTDTDVVRHKLVRDIINSYERYYAKNKESDSKGSLTK